MKKLLCLAAVAAAGLPASALAMGPPSDPAKNAATVCKAQRTAAGDGFTALIASQNPGTKVTASNAYGKCVSAAARKDAAQRKAAKTNAAKQCKAQTPPPKGRAFGQCVSSTAKAKKAKADQAELAKARTTANAAKQCKAQTPPPKGRAFGNCVSTKAQAQNDKPAQP